MPAFYLTEGRWCSVNRDIIQILNDLNRTFYRDQCESFSQTRQSPWTGWTRCLELFLENYSSSSDNQEVAVFDLACGNLRFEAYLIDSHPQLPWTFYAADNCDELADVDVEAVYQHIDVMDVLLSGNPLADQYRVCLSDLVVSFGFMHHVPSMAYRKQVLQSLVGQAKPGALICVSLWQFLLHEKLAQKAQEVHEVSMRELNLEPLEENDYILGWNNKPGAYRYCHSFSEEEIDDLVQSVAQEAVLVDRFRADGRSESLNTYLVLKKKENTA